MILLEKDTNVSLNLSKKLKKSPWLKNWKKKLTSEERLFDPHLYFTLYWLFIKQVRGGKYPKSDSMQTVLPGIRDTAIVSPNLYGMQQHTLSACLC